MRTWIVIILCLASCRTVPAEDLNTQTEHHHIAEIIRSLPTSMQLEKDDSALQRSTTPKERDAIVERLEKAKDGYDQLRKYLCVGSPLTDYPGILSLANQPRVTPFRQRYIRLGLAYWPRSQRKTGYTIYFDSNGIITKIYPLVFSI